MRAGPTTCPVASVSAPRAGSPQWIGDLPPLRRPGRLVHRGRRRPRPLTSQRAARLGRPRRRGARAADRRLRLRQPRHPRAQARPHRGRAGRRGHRAAARPDHDPRRRQRRAPPAGRPRRPRGDVRRGDRAARHHRRAGGHVHHLRPGRRRDLRPRARPDGDLQRVGARDRRPPRRDHRRHVADARHRDRRRHGHRPDAPELLRPHAHGPRRPRGDRRRARPRAGRDRPPARPRPPQQWRANAQWTREFLVPWVHRRITGRSSGDTVSAKHPSLSSVR